MPTNIYCELVLYDYTRVLKKIPVCLYLYGLKAEVRKYGKGGIGFARIAILLLVWRGQSTTTKNEEEIVEKIVNLLWVTWPTSTANTHLITTDSSSTKGGATFTDDRPMPDNNNTNTTLSVASH